MFNVERKRKNNAIVIESSSSETEFEHSKNQEIIENNTLEYPIGDVDNSETVDNDDNDEDAQNSPDMRLYLADSVANQMFDNGKQLIRVKEIIKICGRPSGVCMHLNTLLSKLERPLKNGRRIPWHAAVIMLSEVGYGWYLKEDYLAIIKPICSAITQTT